MSRLSSRSSLRTTALALAVALLVSTSPVAASWSTPGTSTSSSVPTASDADPVGALAEDLDYDTDRIFRFLADDVRYEPYAGILRGARGTLAARAGNSVDKSLLLAALLDASKVPYRFARGTLDPTTAARILGSTVIDAASARAATAAALMRDPARPGDSDTSPAPSASPPAGIDLEQVRADALGQVAEVGTRLDGTVAMLESALHDAGVSLPTDDPSLPAFRDSRSHLGAGRVRDDMAGPRPDTPWCRARRRSHIDRRDAGGAAGRPALPGGDRGGHRAGRRRTAGDRRCARLLGIRR